MSEILWGVDLGGTKIEGVVLRHDPTEWRSKSLATVPGQQDTIARIRIATEAGSGYEHIIQRIAELVQQLSTRLDGKRPTSIGIGTPGALRPDGTMKNCNTTCFNDRSLLRDLEHALECPVHIANDADCFALAEAHWGAGQGHKTVFGVIMGTGVGGGIVVNGRLLNGPNGLTGEWGHTVLDPTGRECYCGNRGCVETYLSGPALERFHHETTGRRLSLEEVARESAFVDECSATISQMCEWFGRALAHVVNVLDPSVIVLGGGAGQVPQLKTLGRECLARSVFGPDFRTPVVGPMLGDSAGVFGAAILTTASDTQ